MTREELLDALVTERFTHHVRQDPDIPPDTPSDRALRRDVLFDVRDDIGGDPVPYTHQEAS